MTNGDNMRSGVSAIVAKDGKVLLVKRGKQPYQGFWSLPGGSIKIGEGPGEAIIRELKEETGLDAIGPKFVTQYEPTPPGEDSIIKLHFVLDVFLIEKFTGTAKAGDDASDLCWVGQAKMDRLEMTPGTGDLIKTILGDRLT